LRKGLVPGVEVLDLPDVGPQLELAQLRPQLEGPSNRTVEVNVDRPETYRVCRNDRAIPFRGIEVHEAAQLILSVAYESLARNELFLTSQDRDPWLENVKWGGRPHVDPNPRDALLIRREKE